MSETLEIRLEPGEPVPDAPTAIMTSGLAGTYRVSIQSIVSRRQHPDGATLLTVKATRRLMEPKESQ